jgi:hypothetical protein
MLAGAGEFGVRWLSPVRCGQKEPRISRGVFCLLQKCRQMWRLVGGAGWIRTSGAARASMGRNSARIWRAIRPDKKHPCWREFVRPWIRPCFGSLRFASFAQVERRCSATSRIRPKLPVQIRGATAPKPMTVTCWRASFPGCAQRREAAMRIVLNRKDEIPREPDSEQAIHRCKLRMTRPLAQQNRLLMT